MAYAADTLALRSGAPGSLDYYHDAGSDTMATVFTAGYFNNSDDDLNLTVDDLIFSQCSDGDFWHKVSALSSGSVTTQLAGGGLGPNNGDVSTGVATAQLKVGVSELGTGTATNFGTVTPYPGARITVVQTGTSTNDTVAVSSSGVTFNERGSTTITLDGTAFIPGFSLLGVSATQWVIVSATGVALS